MARARRAVRFHAALRGVVVLFLMTVVYFGIESFANLLFSLPAPVRSVALGLYVALAAAVALVGIALPLVSAGGSGLVCLGAAIGLLAGVALRGQYDTQRRAADFSPRGVTPGLRRPPSELIRAD